MFCFATLSTHPTSSTSWAHTKQEIALFDRKKKRHHFTRKRVLHVQLSSPLARCFSFDFEKEMYWNARFFLKQPMKTAICHPDSSHSNRAVIGGTKVTFVSVHWELQSAEQEPDLASFGIVLNLAEWTKNEYFRKSGDEREMKAVRWGRHQSSCGRKRWPIPCLECFARATFFKRTIKKNEKEENDSYRANDLNRDVDYRRDSVGSNHNLISSGTNKSNAENINFHRFYWIHQCKKIE